MHQPREHLTSDILIVEEALDDRMAIQDALACDDYRFVYAESVPDAIEQARRAPPDVVLLDSWLHGIDGFEGCRRLRHTPGLASAAIILTLASAGGKDWSLGLEAGADGVLCKPFDVDELRARTRMASALCRSRRLQAQCDRLERLMDCIPEGYVLVDGQGLPVYVNATARFLLGLPALVALPALPVIEWFARLDCTVLVPEAWDAWASGTTVLPTHLRLRVPAKGTHRFAEVSVITGDASRVGPGFRMLTLQGQRQTMCHLTDMARRRRLESRCEPAGEGGP